MICSAFKKTYGIVSKKHTLHHYYRCFRSKDYLGGGKEDFVFNKYIDRKATNLAAERISNRVTPNRQNNEMLR